MVASKAPRLMDVVYAGSSASWNMAVNIPTNA